MWASPRTTRFSRWRTGWSSSKTTARAVGAPRVANAAVLATVVEDGRDKKIRVFKYKKRKHYRRTKGHRQSFTAVRIDKVSA